MDNLEAFKHFMLQKLLEWVEKEIHGEITMDDMKRLLDEKWGSQGVAESHK